MLALSLLGGALAAAARADELLEPIAQADMYVDEQAEPESQAPPQRLRARKVSHETQTSDSSFIPAVEQCAWANDNDDCDDAPVRWKSLALPIPAGLCDQGYRWVAGTEVTFLAPSFRGSSVGTSITDGVATTNAGSSNSFNNFTYAPRIWIGKQGECWGFMARFWYLSDYSSTLNPIIANGSNFGGSSVNALKAYTVDLEAQRMFSHCDGGRCFVTFGARYASLSSDSLLNSMANLGGDRLLGLELAVQRCGFDQRHLRLQADQLLGLQPVLLDPQFDHLR
jgi:hypothetical protein